MNKTVLVIVGVVAIVLAAAALMFDRSDSSAPPRDAGAEELAPGIAQRITQVARIEMRNADGELTLEKNPAGEWTVEQSHGYRANETEVRRLLAGIGTMEVLNRLTSRPDLLPELGLGEPGTEGTRSTLVALKDSGGSEIVSLVFGNTRMGSRPGAGQSVYMRRADQNQAWEVRTTASPSTTLNSWRPREIVNIPSNRVKRMEVGINGELSFEMARPESPGDNFHIDNISDGWRKRETTSGERSIAGFLQSLTLQDVRRDDGFFDTLEKESRLLTQTFDGLEVESILRKEDEKVFMTLSARVNEGLRDYVDALPEPELDSESPHKSLEEVAAEVERINRQTAGWVFELPSWKFSGVERSARTTILEEIVEDVAAAQILIGWEGAPQSRVVGRDKEQARELAEELRVRLEEEGYDLFEELAREYSDEPETAADGGHIGVVGREDMTDAFTDALFELDPGEISAPVETPFGYVLIKRITAP